MVWKEVGVLVDSYEKGKTIFYLDLVLIIDILLLIAGMILRNKILNVTTSLIFIAIIFLFFVFQRKKEC